MRTELRGEHWGLLTLQLGTEEGTHQEAQKRLPLGQQETSSKGMTLTAKPEKCLKKGEVVNHLESAGRSGEIGGESCRCHGGHDDLDEGSPWGGGEEPDHTG